MDSYKKPSQLDILKRWGGNVPFLLVVTSIIFLVWCITITARYPYDGIVSVYSNGYIKEIDPSGPTSGIILIGDTIVTVAGVPIERAIPFYSNLLPGEAVQFNLLRGNETITVFITPIKADSKEIFNRLLPIIVAIIFWLISVIVLAFRPLDAAAGIFSLFCVVSAILLSAGAVSYQGPHWTTSVFSFFLWVIGPISVHFHLRFPQPIVTRRMRILSITLDIIGIGGGLAYLILSQTAFRTQPWFQNILSVVLLFLAFNLLIVVGLLVYSYGHSATSGVRGKIRLVVLGGVLSALPVIVLSIIPDALIHQQILSYSSAFLFLGVLPITYGYAIFRHHLLEIDRHINRGATYILVYLILVAFYFVLSMLWNRLVPATSSLSPLGNTFFVMVLFSAFLPLRMYTQRLMDRVFYGGWYEYRSAIDQVTQGLDQVTELRPLALKVSDRLARTLRLEEACVFLRDEDGDFSVIEVAPQEGLLDKDHVVFPPLPRSSLTYLLRVGAVNRTYLREALSEVVISPEEQQLLDSEQVHLWVPVVGHGQVLGLLALGPKYGGDIFSAEDMDILRVVVRQVGTVIDNVHLLTRLRQNAAELERRVEERTAELYAAKERVEAVLSSVGDGVIVTDLAGKILTLNKAYETQSGYQPQEAVGSKFFELLNVHNNPKSLDKMLEDLHQGKIWSDELVVPRKDGSSFDVRLTIAPISNQTGEIVGFVGSQQDITRQKELERLKDQFVLEVSHELRTPVMTIGLYLDLLERMSAEKKESYLAVLKAETSRVARMIEEILDLSRLEISKQKKITFGPIDLNLVVEQISAIYNTIAKESGLTLTFQMEQNLPVIQGEPNQLARVVDNLLSNAVRYTPTGSIFLRTYSHKLALPTSNDWVCLEVQDTGLGIDPEDNAHLFDRFYRGKNVSQSNIMGTGLGLAIVKEIVDIHDGQIEFESELGKGTTFRVLFPV